MGAVGGGGWSVVGGGDRGVVGVRGGWSVVGLRLCVRIFHLFRCYVNPAFRGGSVSKLVGCVGRRDDA